MQLSHFARVVDAKGRVVGTAYPLSEQRLLTAGHVARELGAEFRVVWGAEQPTAECRARCTWIRAGDVARDGALDAAVLEVFEGSTPEGVGAYLTSQPLRRTVEWESRGYAVAGDAPAKDDETPWAREVPLSGEAFSFVEDASHFQVTAESPPKRAKDWSGISGAPVFVGGVICGIITNGAARFEGNRLVALPSSRLLAEPGFVEAVGLRQSRPEFEALRRDLRSALDADESVRRELFGVAPEWQSAYESGQLEALVEAILTSSALQLTQYFDNAHAGCYMREPRALATADALADILARLLPWLSIRTLVGSGPPRGGSVWPLPASTATTAELLMAGFDERAFDYGELVRGLPYPAADVAVRAGIAIDVDGTIEFRRLSTHLAEWLLGQPVVKDRDLTNHQLEELNAAIEYYANRRRGAVRFYLVLDAQRHAGNRTFLAQIERYLPALAVVLLQDRSDSDESRICWHLRDLIHRARTGEEFSP